MHNARCYCGFPVFVHSRRGCCCPARCRWSGCAGASHGGQTGPARKFRVWSSALLRSNHMFTRPTDTTYVWMFPASRSRQHFAKEGSAPEDISAQKPWESVAGLRNAWTRPASSSTSPLDCAMQRAEEMLGISCHPKWAPSRAVYLWDIRLVLQDAGPTCIAAADMFVQPRPFRHWWPMICLIATYLITFCKLELARSCLPYELPHSFSC